MLSSLIFAALAAAWLIVLVPMFARRRQNVSHTTDTALAARVVRRGGQRRPPASGGQRWNRGKEAFEMPETDETDMDAARSGQAGPDPEFERNEDGQWRRVYSDDARAGRRYRPGRGGFDPEAAALAARTKYARRQRTVLVVLAVAVTTAVLAALVWPVVWWGHALVDLLLVGYLTYLRRQVRIEEDVRARRLARLSGESDEDEFDEYGDYADPDGYADHETDGYADEEYDAEDPEEYGAEPADPERAASRVPSASHGAVPGRAVVLDVDEEDPEFDELDERTWQPYRRAVGE